MAETLAITIDQLLGQNNYDVATKLGKGESTACLNMVPVQNGSIKSRGGFTQILGNLPTGFYPVSFLHYKKVNGTKQDLCLADNGTITRLIRWNAGTSDWVTVHNFANHNNYKGGMTILLDKVIAGNGVDKNIYWNGSSVTAFGNNDPKGWFYQVFEGRLIISGDEAEPSNIAYSRPWNATDPDAVTWDGSDYDKGGIIAVNRNDGQGVTGLGVKDSVLMIEKSDSKFIMTFEEIQSASALVPKIVPFRTSFGTVAPRSYVEVENDFVSMAKDGFRSTGNQENFTSMQASLLSQTILQSFDSINPAQKDKACAHYLDNRYYASVSTGTSVNNDFSPMYDFLGKSWFPLNGILARSFFTYEDAQKRQYLGFCSQTESKLYYLNKDINYDGQDFDPVAITKKWQSKKFDFDLTDSIKTLSKISVRGSMPASTVLNISAIQEGATQTNAIQIVDGKIGIAEVVGNLVTTADDPAALDRSPVFGEGLLSGFVLGVNTSETGEPWYDFLAIISYAPTSQFIDLQVKFENTEVNQPFQVNMFKIYAEADISDNINQNFVNTNN